MGVYTDREAFIPYCREDIIALCIQDGKLQGEDGKKFREFCEILIAYQHFDALQHLQSLKHNFLPWNPDADTKPLVSPEAKELQEREHDFLEKFAYILQKANYRQLTQEEWLKAKVQASLIKLRLDVDFADFDRWLCYHRGSTNATVAVKKLFGKRDVHMDIYERVVLLLKFKDEEYFKAKKKKVEKLNFTPGRMYLYFYKNVPQSDLEVLFPNVQVSMNWQEKLQFWIPTLLAGFYTVFKVSASLFILLAAILFLCGLTAVADWLGIVLTSKEEALARLATVTSVLIILGAFAVKQYIKYKNKRLQFLKDITDTLFFRNLDCNAGVFYRLLDEAEEEEGKETILTYYHLLTSKAGMTEEQMDDCIEQWLEQKCHSKVDFAVHKALQTLKQIKGMIEIPGKTAREIYLIERDANGCYRVVGLDEARTIVDYTWDNLFRYNK
jgi:hypothetical protein